jgi:pyridinium-3,5-bisthiocarboxylic acid mononucleotide nickel chelatase
VRVAYLEPFSGVSGDMLLGALVDCGVPAEELAAMVESLGVPGLTIGTERVRRCGVSGTKATVSYPPQTAHRHLRDIVNLVEQAPLADEVRDEAIKAFLRLAEVEAAIHGVLPQQVHFHEVGAADAIADVLGVVWGLRRLGVEQVLVGPVNVGSGCVRCAHGTMPVPAPATLRLLQGWRVFSRGPERELTTPTGAVLMTTLGAQVAQVPLLRVERDGYGAGAADPEGWPNCLRMVLGETVAGVAEKEPGRGHDHHHAHSHAARPAAPGGGRERPEEPGETAAEPAVLDEILVEELAVDGICGVY